MLESKRRTRFMTMLFRIVHLLALLFSLAVLPLTLAHPYQAPKHEVTVGPHIASTIREVLKSNEIIPQVLDDFEPSYALDVIYKPSKKHAAGPVLLGNDLPVKAVSKRPVFSITQIASFSAGSAAANDDDDNWHSSSPTVKAHSSNTFTLILTDPDALSRAQPNKSEMCHWILTNITAERSVDLTPMLGIQGQYDSDERLSDTQRLRSAAVFDDEYSASKKNELESYFPPAPPPRTGPHRYVFVLLEGDGGKHGIKKPSERAHWGYGKDRHGVRDWASENGLKIVGANFFFAQNKKQ